MTLVTLVYVPGILERKKFRRLLDQHECTYRKRRGTFYVTVDIKEHVKLAKEFYRG